MTVEGPFRFTIELFNLKFSHKFFLLDAATPFIAGFDLIVQAGLIIDPVRKLVWSLLTGAESEAPKCHVMEIFLQSNTLTQLNARATEFHPEETQRKELTTA